MALNNLAIRLDSRVHFWVVPGLRKGTDIRKPERPSTEKATIINLVCNFYELDYAKVRSKSRKRELVVARQLIQYFLHKYASMTLTSIGQEFPGLNKRGMDHTTIIHSIRTVENLRSTDQRFNAQVTQLENLLS